MAAKRHFLNQVGEERRTEKRREVRLDCKIYYLRNGLRGYSSQAGKVLNISENGCKIACPVIASVPEHIYLIVEGIKWKFPCGVVDRSDGCLHTNFTTPLPTELVDKLSKRKIRL